MDKIQIFFVLAVLLINFFQVKFIFALKDRDPDLWEQAGKPTLFNSGGLLGVSFFVLLNDHKDSKSESVKRLGQWYKYCLLCLLFSVAIYFLVPLEFWYG